MIPIAENCLQVACLFNDSEKHCRHYFSFSLENFNFDVALKGFQLLLR
jgi:hypothetical protein